jgi:hypothetical protein
LPLMVPSSMVKAPTAYTPVWFHSVLGTVLPGVVVTGMLTAAGRNGTHAAYTLAGITQAVFPNGKGGSPGAFISLVYAPVSCGDDGVAAAPSTKANKITCLFINSLLRYHSPASFTESRALYFFARSSSANFRPLLAQTWSGLMRSAAS